MALKLLGYARVCHNPPFEQLRHLDGGADMGVTVFYKYLDYRFPGSRFVLTVRKPEQWLPSIEYIMGKYPIGACNVDVGIMRRMLVYECVAFDRDRFIAAYARHLDDVRRYFRGRPGDLLEMDISAGDGWDKLCPFLGLPAPECAFPHGNQRDAVPPVVPGLG